LKLEDKDVDEVTHYNGSQEGAATEVALSTGYICAVLSFLLLFIWSDLLLWNRRGCGLSDYILKKRKTCYKVAQKKRLQHILEPFYYPQEVSFLYSMDNHGKFMLEDVCKAAGEKVVA
jgi:hypothetical protein